MTRALIPVNEAADILGISHEAAMRLLDKGVFGGCLRLGDQVLVSRRRAEESRCEDDKIKKQNESGHIEIPDFGDEDPYAERTRAREATRAEHDALDRISGFLTVWLATESHDVILATRLPGLRGRTIEQSIADGDAVKVDVALRHIK